MNKIIFIITFFAFNNIVLAQITPYEKGNKNVTATYVETIAFYKTLDAKSDMVTMKEIGETDANYPLHVVYVSNKANANFDPAKRTKNTTVIFINNGIHPGEPDGIDASMMLVRDIVNKKTILPDNVLLAIIPVYNIGGCLNRSANYRVDQNGPEEFGFRGNSQNFDLNRDFIKSDSKEAKSFAKIFQLLQPQIFIDNHVSNGADYQHIMTLLSSQHNKLGGAMGDYMVQTFQPEIFKIMKTKGYDLVPYVNFFGETPEQGWTEFFDGPRYSSGYAALWHCFAFVPETHMLKPYPQRVDATYKIMESFIQFAKDNAREINEAQQKNRTAYMEQNEFPLDWTLDKTKESLINFKGYTAGKKESLISGQPRLFYDRTKPFEKQIPFCNYYNNSNMVKMPKAYILPQGWPKVIELLKTNNVQLTALQKDTIIWVESYKIKDYKSGTQPYEGHHTNTNVQVEKLLKKVPFRKGDYIIKMNQLANRFLLETLEPTAKDSYFTWNFFDGILGQKEGYSDYMFEETALDILKENPAIKTALDEKKKADEKFAKNGDAQLDFIYKQSKYFETNYMQYPVYRIL
jgi:hypothetical protein